MGMNKKVLEYFTDLDKLNLKKENNTFIFSDPQIIRKTSVHQNINSVDYFQIGKTYAFVKNWDGVHSVFDIASTQMYNTLDIPSPPIYIISDPNKKPTYHHFGQFYTLTEDIYNIPHFHCATRVYDCKEYQSATKQIFHLSDKWAILLNSNLRSSLLEFMTKKCYDDLINLYLIDTLRAEGDRHQKNFFLYKSKGSSKFTGIIAIDNAMGNICKYIDYPFENFLHDTYVSITPFNGMDNASHTARMRTIREFISQGELDDSQILILRLALNHNFPEDIRNVCKKYNITEVQARKDLYDHVSRLWEYNRNLLSDELGM